MIKYRSKTFTVMRSRVTEPPGKFMECAQDVADLARTILQECDADREHFLVFAVNNKHKVIGHKVLFSGTVDSAAVYPRDVILTALRLEAVAIIVCHNHPSGDPNPSQADSTITRNLKEACKLMDIRLLDHIVLGESGYSSFAELGQL